MTTTIETKLITAVDVIKAIQLLHDAYHGRPWSKATNLAMRIFDVADERNRDVQGVLESLLWAASASPEADKVEWNE